MSFFDVFNYNARRFANKYAGGLVMVRETTAYGIVVGYEEWMDYIIVERPKIITYARTPTTSANFVFNKRKYKKLKDLTRLESWDVYDVEFRATKEQMVKFESNIQTKLHTLQQTNNVKAAISAYKEFDVVMCEAEGRIMPNEYKEYIRRANFHIFLCGKKYDGIVRSADVC